jgi:hypothetical protein
MSYTLQVPTSYNTAGLRAALLSPACDVRLALGIDSRTDLTAPNCPIWYGIYRQWDVPWSGLGVLSAYLGSTYWLSGGVANGSYATRNARTPQATASNGQTDISSMLYLDYDMTGDAGADWPYQDMFLRSNQAVRGDPFAGLETTVRVPWYRHASGMTNVRFRSYRTTGTDASPSYATVNTGSSFSMNGADGWQTSELSCGTATGTPGVSFRGDTATVNETGTRAYLGPLVFYRGAPGSRVSGMFLTSFGIGGYTNLDTLRQWGGDGANAYCTVANAAWFLVNVMLSPNYIMLCGPGQNAAANETTELNAGTQTTFYNNITAIINQINTVYDTAGVPRPTYILANDYKTGYTDLNHQTRGRALFRIAQERGGIFIDLFQLMKNTITAWLADGVHLSGPALLNYPAAPVGNGGDYLAAAMWNEIMNTRQAPPVRGRAS